MKNILALFALSIFVLFTSGCSTKPTGKELYQQSLITAQNGHGDIESIDMVTSTVCAGSDSTYANAGDTHHIKPNADLCIEWWEKYVRAVSKKSNQGEDAIPYRAGDNYTFSFLDQRIKHMDSFVASKVGELAKDNITKRVQVDKINELVMGNYYSPEAAVGMYHVYSEMNDENSFNDDQKRALIAKKMCDTDSYNCELYAGYLAFNGKKKEAISYLEGKVPNPTHSNEYELYQQSVIPILKELAMESDYIRNTYVPKYSAPETSVSLKSIMDNYADHMRNSCGNGAGYLANNKDCEYFNTFWNSRISDEYLAKLDMYDLSKKTENLSDKDKRYAYLTYFDDTMNEEKSPSLTNLEGYKFENRKLATAKEVVSYILTAKNGFSDSTKEIVFKQYFDASLAAYQTAYDNTSDKPPFDPYFVFDKTLVDTPEVMKSLITGIYYQCTLWDENNKHCEIASKIPAPEAIVRKTTIGFRGMPSAEKEKAILGLMDQEYEKQEYYSVKAIADFIKKNKSDFSEMTLMAATRKGLDATAKFN